MAKVRTENSTVEAQIKKSASPSDNSSITERDEQQSANETRGGDGSPSKAQGTTCVGSQHGPLPTWPMSEDEIGELLKPRRVGPDGIFHIVEQAVAKPKDKAPTATKPTTAVRITDGPSKNDRQIPPT